MNALAEATRLFPFSDVELANLAEIHGTPTFVYRASEAVAQARRLRAAVPPRVRLAYAVKANPHPVLLARLAAENLSFDCASGGELTRVAALNLPPERVFYAGPGKRMEELSLALRLGVRVQAEGWEDLARLDALASGPVDVNVRVHPLAAGEEATRILGGSGPSAFGVDEEDLPDLLARALTLKHVRIRGLHCFTASNQREADRLKETHASVLALAERLHREHGLTLDQIDLGGGLGVAYAEDEAPLDLDRFGAHLRDLLADHPWFTGELILEPGRFLAAPTGVYLARVIRVKASRGATFAILEGGVNHLLRPALTGQPFPVRAVGKGPGAIPHTLAGPLCTSLDRLGDVALPHLQAGDLLAFGRVGAYGFTEAMTNFLSHPVPPEVWVD
ncbi:MAG TPA: alanine racemase [Holophagaceae bacterium]|nr:alanine racemase [Holophagaceae bacterium]